MEINSKVLNRNTLIPKENKWRKGYVETKMVFNAKNDTVIPNMGVGRCCSVQCMLGAASAFVRTPFTEAPQITERHQWGRSMPAHSKTPCTSPGIAFPSGNGVVRGRRGQQLESALGGVRRS